MTTVVQGQGTFTKYSLLHVLLHRFCWYCTWYSVYPICFTSWPDFKGVTIDFYNVLSNNKLVLFSGEHQRQET